MRRIKIMMSAACLSLSLGIGSAVASDFGKPVKWDWQPHC